MITHIIVYPRVPFPCKLSIYHYLLSSLLTLVVILFSFVANIMGRNLVGLQSGCVFSSSVMSTLNKTLLCASTKPRLLEHI